VIAVVADEARIMKEEETAIIKIMVRADEVMDMDITENMVVDMVMAVDMEDGR